MSNPTPSGLSRRSINRLFCLLAALALGGSGLILLFFLACIAWNGLEAIDLEFLLLPAKNFGAEGGIFYQILGTLLIVLFAAIFALPIALGTAIFQSEYLKKPWLHKLLKMLIYGLNGVPSIIFGIFGLIFFVNILGTGTSWLIGAIVLGMMILPTVTLASYHAIHSIPNHYRESALALGFTHWQLIRQVLIPQGFAGTLTGLLLGMARAAGETAPIMFIATAFSGVDIPSSFSEPVTTLPTHILALAQQATHPDALRNAWGASLVLLMIVIMFSASGLYARLKFKTNHQR